MQLFIIVIFAINVATVKGHKLEPYQPQYCETELEIAPASQTVILDLEENFNEPLKTCIIKNAHSTKSILLINSNSTKLRVSVDRCKTNDHPNVVIITKQITSSLLDKTAVKEVLRSHRSVVSIVTTSDKNFKCKNELLTADDFSYLETFMNELWHKYRIAHVGIRFPLTCQEIVAVYDRNRKTNQTVYDRTIKLINGTDIKKLNSIFGQKTMLLTKDYPLRANIFERFPTVISECDKLHYYTKINFNITNGYCGLDAFVMHTLIKYYKFKLELIKRDECNAYGHKSDTNLTGSLGCISRNEFDISFNSRFMTMYSTDKVHYLHFVATDSLCALVKQADIIPLSHYAISIYTPHLWFIIVSLNVAIGVFWWKTSEITKKQESKEKKVLFSYVIDAFTTTMFGISNKNNESRLLKGICLCSSIMFLAMYQGHVNHLFTTLARYDNINKLEQLYKSDISLHVSPSLHEIMKQIYNKENKYERDFMRRVTNTGAKKFSLDTLLEQPNVALLGRKKDIEIEILSKYTESETKQPLINIVDQCLRTYYLSYICRPGFAFVEEIEQFMQRVREAGLSDIYYEWTCGMLRVPSHLPKIRNEPRHFKSLKLHQVKLAFGLLALGQTVSLFIFIVELWRRSNR